MEALEIRGKEDTRWDCLALGEVMLRLDPGPSRVRTARAFSVCEGGGEYNVARALQKVFELRTAVVTSLVDSEVGHLLEDLMMAGGVDMRHCVWLPHDGLGASARVGLNFTERGYGQRPPLGVSDRARSAASQLKPGDIDWHRIFFDEGVRWFHTGGIFASLSDTTAELVAEAMSVARSAGTVVSYDLNYRPSLWVGRGGQQAAIATNKRLAPLVDVMIGNEGDFNKALGFEIPGREEEVVSLDPSAFAAIVGEVFDRYPNFSIVATTLRNARTANAHDWSAVAYSPNDSCQARVRERLGVFDRVGGGDGFASGLIWALLDSCNLQYAVEAGAAHGALAMSTPGDNSMATAQEVQHAIEAKSVRAVR